MEINVILSLVFKEKIVDKIWIGHIHIIKAWLDLNPTIINVIYSCLPDVTHTEEQCKKILSPILQTRIMSTVICWNFAPNYFMTGTVSMQVLGVTRL